MWGLCSPAGGEEHGRKGARRPLKRGEQGTHLSACPRRLLHLLHPPSPPGAGGGLCGTGPPPQLHSRRCPWRRSEPNACLGGTGPGPGPGAGATGRRRREGGKEERGRCPGAAPPADSAAGPPGRDPRGAPAPCPQRVSGSGRGALRGPGGGAAAGCAPLFAPPPAL